MDQQTTYDFDEDYDLGNTDHQSTILDRDPFFKDYVITLRYAVDTLAEITMSNLYPIIIAFLISFYFEHMICNRFDHLYIRQYDWYESVSLVVGIYVWNIISAILSHHHMYKIQFTLSRILSFLLLVHNVTFLYRWFLTPGTTTAIYMSHFFCSFLLWNYFGLGVAAFFLPVHQRFMNYYVVFFCSQLGFYVWITFTPNSIRIFLFGIAMWEILIEFMTCLTPTGKDHERGLHHSIYIKSDKPVSITNHSEDESVEDIHSENEKNINNKSPNELLQETKNVYHLPKRYEELLIIEEREKEFGIIPDKEYGRSALLKLEIRCRNQIEEGIHVNVLTLMFYQCMLIFTAHQNTHIGIITILNTIGFSIFLNETSMIINENQAPLKILLYFFSEVVTYIIVDMTKPCLKHMLLSAIIESKVIEEFFSFKNDL